MVVRYGVEKYLEKLGIMLGKSKNNALLATSKLKTLLLCFPLNVKPKMIISI